jgi:2-dehydropantoate 2-reductase
MRICIIGAGAIGGFVGARLALAGEEVTFIARGRNLDAINADGMRVYYRDGREEIASSVDATDNYDSAGTYDAIVLALKAHQLGEVCARLAPLCHDDTVVITMQNGVPFWYFDGHGGALAGRAIESVDPGGAIKAAIPARRIIGCVVYAAAEVSAPGRVVHINGDRFPVGELDGSKSERLQRVSQAFVNAGLKSPLLDDVRAEVWLKLWGNLAFNPISALTHAMLADICADRHGRALAEQMMREAQAVAQKLGVAFRVTLEKRIEGAASVGRHKTSMLQDVEAGRAIEIDAVLGSVVELGELAGVSTPTMRAIYQAAKLLDRTMRDGMVAVRSVPMPSS